MARSNLSGRWQAYLSSRDKRLRNSILSEHLKETDRCIEAFEAIGNVPTGCDSHDIWSAGYWNTFLAIERYSPAKCDKPNVYIRYCVKKSLFGVIYYWKKTNQRRRRLVAKLRRSQRRRLSRLTTSFEIEEWRRWVVSHLDERERFYVRKRFFEGQQHNEVVRQMNLSKATVDKIRASAITKMKLLPEDILLSVLE